MVVAGHHHHLTARPRCLRHRCLLDPLHGGLSNSLLPHDIHYHRP
jgi:hypothetical protein